MKRNLKHIIVFTSAVAVAVLTSCEVPAGGGAGYNRDYNPSRGYSNSRSSSSSTDYTARRHDAYSEGYNMGRRDARDGLTRDYNRHEGRFDILTKSSFRDGYLKAYAEYSH